MANIRRILMFLTEAKLILGLAISFALFDATLSATTPLPPETTSTSVPGIECPKFNSYYTDNGTQLIVETVPGICELVIQPHEPSVIRGLGEMFGKKMKRISKKIRYPDIIFRNVDVGISSPNDIYNECAMPVRHRGPFIVMDTAENCQMIIGIERQRRMRGGKPRRKMSRAERRQNRKLNKSMNKAGKRPMHRPVVRYVSGEMLLP